METEVQIMSTLSTTAEQESKEWVEKLARFGYAVRGVVYLVVGGLAVQAALGTGGATVGSKGALSWIVTEPYGKVLLGIVALGLFSYALWRFVQAIFDPESKGSDTKGMITRAAYFVIGFTHAGLGVAAVRLVTGAGSGSGSGSQEQWTARLMSQPFGQWLVVLAGLIVIGAALYELYMAISGKYEDRLKTSQMSAKETKVMRIVGRIGYLAHFVTIGLIGTFLVQAGLTYDPQKAGGLGEALGTIQSEPYGPWLLGVVAIGLLSYGIFSFAVAKYRRIVVQ